MIVVLSVFVQTLIADFVTSDSKIEIPLAGKVILNSRPKSPFKTHDKLTYWLEKNGADVIRHPVTELVSMEDRNQIDYTIHRLSKYRALVFVSASGVHFFCKYLNEMALANGGVEFDFDLVPAAAIGESTAKFCRQMGFNVEIVGSSGSESLAEKIISQNLPGKLLVLRADRGSNILADCLRRSGQEFDELVVYQTRNRPTADPKVLSKMQDSEIDWVTFTSSAIVEASIQLFGDALKNCRLAAISEKVAFILEKHGCFVDVIADEANFESLANGIALS